MARLTALFVVVCATCAACDRKPAPTPQNVTGPVGSGPDRLAAGEAPPGVEKVHDLILPRGSTIERRFGTTIYALVPLSGEDMANYVRRQSTDAEALIGPEGTVFTKVVVKGANPDHHLRIEINGPRGGMTSVLIDRIDARPPPEKVGNEAAMKKAGLTVDGKLLDPTHTE